MLNEGKDVVLIGPEEGCRRNQCSTASIEEAQMTSTAHMYPVYREHQTQPLQDMIRHMLAHSLEGQSICAGTGACSPDRYTGGAHAQVQHSLDRRGTDDVHRPYGCGVLRALEQAPSGCVPVCLG